MTNRRICLDCTSHTAPGCTKGYDGHPITAQCIGFSQKGAGIRSAVDVIGIEAVQRLREAGFVVVHQVPNTAMLKAGYSCHRYLYGSIETTFRRMVAESIRQQNEESE